jgi:FtsP/CotA-like multicopper oxidase with cupredoxin domain
MQVSKVFFRVLPVILAVSLPMPTAHAQQGQRSHPGKGVMSAQELSTLPGPPATEGNHARTEADPADAVCARSAPGAVLPEPQELKSVNGVLEVTLNFKSAFDEQGLARYCYVTDTGFESPTLRVNPGDKLIIHFRNGLSKEAVPSANDSMAGMKMNPNAADNTGSNPCNGVMNPNATNIHFHGTNTAPVCGQDNVTTVLVQPGQSFEYSVQIPLNEPPGLYWYHPHPHGYSEMQVQGGASGALIVEGLQEVDTSLLGLQERVLVLRDQNVPYDEMFYPNAPGWDLSINFVPITFPGYTPAIIQTNPSEKELWRVANTSADTIINLEYVVNGTAQAMTVEAIDGVPIAAGPSGLKSTVEKSILLGPGARAEFVVTTPAIGEQAELITEHWNTGKDGDNDPSRPIAKIVSQKAATDSAAGDEAPAKQQPAGVAPLKAMRFAALASTTPVAQRNLYFSEVLSDPGDPNSHGDFYITEEGETPSLFQMGQGPSIVVHSGTVEDWVVENRALEDHIFHIHQIHFQVLEVNGKPVSDPALRDTVDIPSWDGTSSSYPSVKLRMDFRDPNIVGYFVYHCHILAHEDGGMMAVIQVLPPGLTSVTTSTASVAKVAPGGALSLTAHVSDPSSGTAIPTGVVQFELNGSSIGGPVKLAAGVAALTTAITGPAGTGQLTAFYEGDSKYAESISSAIPLLVLDFVLSSTGASATAGTPAKATVKVTAADGFTNPATLTCAVPANMTGAACSLGSASISGSGQVNLTVTSKSAGGTGSAAGTPKGTYQVVVNGTAGTFKTSVHVPITIN